MIAARSGHYRFLAQLAAHFRTPLTRLLGEMSSAEFLFWQEIGSREFLGDERSDYRAARIEAAVANFAGRAMPDGQSVKPTECMPFLGATPKKPRRWTRKRAEAECRAVFSMFREAPKQQQG